MLGFTTTTTYLVYLGLRCVWLLYAPPKEGPTLPVSDDYYKKSVGIASRYKTGPRLDTYFK